MAHIRPTALCCFIRDDKEFLGVHGFDHHKREEFFRFPGGGIEFGETGEQAVRREIYEELGQEIRIIRHLGFLENLFDYDGKPHHEIVQVFLAKFVDPVAYQRDRFEVTENYEGCQNLIASWIPIEEFRSGRKILYPAGVLQALDGAAFPQNTPYDVI
jgi:8-oxo-dGTP pyrophosphatase MutT (NUDIX family)